MQSITTPAAALTLAAGAFLIGPAAHAVPVSVLNDPNPSTTGWFYASSGTNPSGTNVTVGATGAVQFSLGDAGTVPGGAHVFRGFDATTLANVGDSIVLSMDLDLDVDPETQFNRFVIGLFGSNSATLASSNQNTTGPHDRAFEGFRLDLTTGGSGAGQVSANRPNSGGSDTLITSDGVGSTSNPSGSLTVNNNGENSISIDFTRSGASEVSILATVNGVTHSNPGVISLPSGSGNWEDFSFTLDTIALGNRDDDDVFDSNFAENGPATMTLDNVSVVYDAIPEPASLALMGAGALCLLKRQRKSASGGLPCRRR